MTTFALALKDEIRRLARKEVKLQTGKTARVVIQYRRQLGALKRQLREQSRQIARLQKPDRITSASMADTTSADKSNRFSARSVRAQRRRVGLSAADYAQLVGVSPLTIYNWEHGKSRPRKEQLAALIAIRGIGKREALAQLQRAAAAKSQPPTAHRRRRKPK